MSAHRRYAAAPLVALIAALPLAAAAQATSKGAEVLKAERADVSKPLREFGNARRGYGPVPVRALPLAAWPQQDDTVMQTGTPGPFAAVMGLNVAGIGDGEQGYVPNSTPPDPSLAVGTTQVVQVAGDAMAVYDKASGAVVAGFPKTGNALWSGFGGACENAADGMVTVRFDRAASRWVIVLTAGTPVLQCVAVSTSADATGSYARYAFAQGGSVLADGTKLGIWPDAYYLAMNRFDSEQAFAGTRVCALERAAMLTGAPASQQCFQLPAASGGGLMPADLDGALAPPAGTPNPVVGLASNALQFWKFRVDWARPAGSTLSGPVSLPVAPFTPACDGGHCILQPRTSQKLDARSDRLMARAAYRVFADGHDALVLTHAVKMGRRPRLAGAGQRWYEVRNAAQVPVLAQQGTYAPDRKFRWMGSIAMDKAGNIALGYSVASSTLYPGWRATGRLAGDAPGQMQNEVVLQAGAGSQLPGSIHWGEQSAMVLDPADDCSFWTTNTYLKASSASAWSTRIASFRFPNCAP